MSQPAPVPEDAGAPLLAPERIAALDGARRAEWTRYLQMSAALHAADTASMNAELRQLGRARMTKAPYSAPEFDYGTRSGAWLASDSARRLLEGVLSYQTPSGGWSKRTDMWMPRVRGMSYYAETDDWHYIPTLDNGATMSQLMFVLRAASFHGDARVADAFNRGFSLMIAAQQPNGCWPQSYPLEGGYHDAITFNDDVTVRALILLDTVAQSRAAIVNTEQRQVAREAVNRGVECLVKSQVVTDGRRTIWGQQQDPLTYAVVPARKYELAGLAGRESAAIMTYLMSLPKPDSRVMVAIDDAAQFFREHAISGHAYDAKNGFRPSSEGTLLWARLTEIGTNKPIFANRDGVKLYDWNQLTDRRTGYAWFGTEPAAALKTYETWKRHHE
jgi:PelA/Pel-15E family pectate lyase